jgi:hypothetical protein
LARANATDMSMKLPFFHDYIKTTSISWTVKQTESLVDLHGLRGFGFC